ncbi:MAG: outer membrane protein assembly factor BamA [bacterium]|nr:outer membrane protein assembly factor BamA [bacterium]
MNYKNLSKYSLFILVILLVFNGIAGAQQEVPLLKVRSIEVIGNDRSDADRIRLNSGLGPIGKTFTGDDVAEAIKRLWNLGTFSDIKINKKETSTDSEYDFIIEVKEHPQLDLIQFKGNDNIKTDKLLDELNYYRGQTISPSRVEGGRKNILELYKEKGYLLATAEAEVVRSLESERARVSVIYTVDEGKKVKIEKIYFEGNEAFSDGKLRKQFKGTKEDGLFTGGNFVKTEYEEDKGLLIEFYKKEGYKFAEVVSDSLYYDDLKEHMFIKVNVNEGMRHYFRNITFTGNEIFPDGLLQERLDIGTGDAYNEEKLQRGKGEIQNTLYYNAGHLFASVIESPVPVQGTDSIDVEFNITENRAVQVYKVDIYGNTVTKEKVIRREIRIKPGDTFSYQMIERSMNALMQLNYFQVVNPNVNLVNQSNPGEEKVNIIFTVQEKSTQTAAMNAGYSQRDGLIGGISLGLNNFMGNGQQLQFDWQFGKIYRSFSLGFTEPYLFDTKTIAGFNVFDLRRGGEWYGYNQESRGLTLRLGRRFTWPDDYFQGNWYLGFSKNRYEELEGGFNISNYFYLGNATRVYITQVLSRISMNHAEFPTLGSEVSHSVQYTGGFLGGTEDFVKNNFVSKWYMPAFWKFVLAQSAETGIINTFNNNETIGPQELFFMGGSAISLGTSLRGYDERQVGSHFLDQYPTGGRVQVKFSTELRFPISAAPTIYGLAFAEAGNVWPHHKYFNPFDLRKSAGFGIRLFMPMIGMIGFDFGYGYDNYDEIGNKVGKWKTHFQFGRGF